MAQEQPHLRAVSGTEPESEGASPPPAERGPRWLLPALGITLAVALALLVWSRVELGARIADLQDQVRGLQAAVEERDRVIGAHQSRMDEIRLRIQELHTIAERPLPKAPQP
jgi:hypothetical protein